MKATLLGHASILVELDGGNVLMDPVFQDPFEEGAAVMCPSREVFLDRLPKIDLLILSHAHLDHFDIPTLARIPRDCEVICPLDAVVEYALGKLGFKYVRPSDASERLKFGSFELMTTQSTQDYIVEFGVVFQDRSGTFWNQVDTVLTPGTIEYTRMEFGHIDLLFAMFASQNFGFFGSMRAGYPLDITRANLANVKQVAPSLVVPGSAGFRFTGPFAWSNAFMFPVSRARFLDDLARVTPETPTALANPGDVFEIAEGAVTRHAGASPIARMIADDTHLVEFDAGAPVPPLTDPNSLGYSDEVLEEQVSACFEEVVRFVKAAYLTPDSLVTELLRVNASYGLGVVFPDGREQWLRIQFERGEPEITRSERRLRAAMSTHRIAASALTAWARNEKPYFWYRGFSRLSQTLAGTSMQGSAVREGKEPPDLLTYYLNRKRPGSELAETKRVDRRMAPFL
jgi:UDP-MurNAc hydroxylase